MKFPIIAFVPHGANMREFAQVKKEDATMKLNPTCKAALAKAYGSHAEKSVAMADLVQKAEEDPNAPPQAPTEMAEAHNAMMAELHNSVAPHMPSAPVEQAAKPETPAEQPTEMGEPDVEMSAETMMSVEKADAFVANTISKLAKSITVEKAEKFAKAIDAGKAARKAYDTFKSNTPVMKAAGPKKLTFKQYVGFQNDIMSRFVQLIMDFLPLLSEIEEQLPSTSDLAPAPAAGVTEGMNPEAMAAKVGEEVMKQTSDVIAKGFDDLAKKLEGRIGTVETSITAIAKSRGASNQNPAEDVHGARPSKDDSTAFTPYVDLVEKMRSEGKLTNGTTTK